MDGRDEVRVCEFRKLGFLLHCQFAVETGCVASASNVCHLEAWVFYLRRLS